MNGEKYALLFSYGELQETRWRQKYKLVSKGKAAIMGHLRWRTPRDPAASFTGGRHGLPIPGTVFSVSWTELKAIAKMEKPEYKLVVASFTSAREPVWAFAFAGTQAAFRRLPRARNLPHADL